MLDLVTCGRSKLDDPILMRWALRRYQNAVSCGSQNCQSMEQAWFHDLALRRWIDTDHHEILEALFRILPARLFRNLQPTIIARWSAWGGSVGARAITVLKECPLAEALLLLAKHIDLNFLDFEKTFAVIDYLTDIPSADALKILDNVTARITSLPDGHLTKKLLSHALLQPIATHNAGSLVEWVEVCVRAGLDKEEAGRLLRAVCSALCGNDTFMENARALIDGRPCELFRSLKPLFISQAPLEECDRILTEPDSWPQARSLLERYRGVTAATDAAVGVAAVGRLLDTANPADLAGFAVAAVLAAFEREEIDVAGLSIEEAFAVLALDISACRHSLQLTQRLSAFEPAVLAIAVNDHMPTVRDGWGGVRLATLVGELHLVDAIPVLIDSLGNEGGDYLCEAAEKALARIGSPAEQALIAQWDQLDASQKIYARTVLEQIGGEPTCAFAIDRFDELFRGDHDGWCALIESVPDRKAVDLLAPEVERKQPVIDQCFYRLCVLTGSKRADLDETRKRIEKHRQDIRDRQRNLAAGNFGELADKITLTLSCEKCGDINRYEVKSVVMGRSGVGPRYFVGDEMRCASCGEWADFEFTAEAHMQMMAALMMVGANKESAKGDRKGPLHLIDVNYRWKTRPAPEVMAELKAAVAREPKNVVNHLRLARFHYVLGRPRHAAECYSRAFEIEPFAMEAGLGLAHVMADTGEHRNSYERLCAMLEEKAKWRFFRVDELPPKELAEDFVHLFNKLQLTLDVRGRPLLHTSFLQSPGKVGRNDLCPCGSGKKFKKCCADRQASPLH
jgi:hypothetical protein